MFCSGVVAVLYFIFYNSLDNEFLSDDWVFLYKSNYTTSFLDILSFAFDLKTGWFFRPMQWLFTWILYNLFNLNPFAFHFLIITIHSLNAFLVGVLSYYLYDKEITLKNNRLIASSLIALFFFTNWHHHEALFWYSAFNEPLSAFFQFLTLILLLIILSAPNFKWYFSFLMILPFFLSLMTKESSSILPFVIASLIFLKYILNLNHKNRGKFTITHYVLILIPLFLILSSWVYIFISRPTQTINQIATNANRTISVQYIFEGLIRYLCANYIEGYESLPIDIFIWGQLIIILLFIVIIRRRYLWLWSFLWILLASIPYIAFNSTPSDRYLYITIAPSSILLIETSRWLVFEIENFANISNKKYVLILIGCGLVFFILINLSKMNQKKNKWDIASRIATDIVNYVHIELKDIKPNTTICLDNIPDSYHKTQYIFRNGIEEALYLRFKRNDFRVRFMVQPTNESFRKSIFNTQGCDYFFIYSNSTKTLSLKENM